MANLGGKRIGLLEARMGSELSELVRRHGGEPVCAPAVKEQGRSCAGELNALLDAYRALPTFVAVFTTGVGVTALLNEAQGLGRRDELVQALARATTVCRGPKPAGVLSREGLQVSVKVKPPFTTAELKQALAELPLQNARALLLHYGERSEEVVAALTSAGARVDELLLYEWALPDDLQPLRDLVARLLRGELAAVAFTSQVQVRHLFQIAEQSGQADALRTALNGPVVVAAVGPTCARAAEDLGVRPRVVPENPKMGPLVASLAAYVESGGKR